MTKLQMRLDFWTFMASDEVKELREKLFKLWQNKRITYGCYSLYDTYEDYDYKEMRKKNLTKWKLNYHINNLKKKINELKIFVNEQENLPFEETQMQVLIANGTIRYI